MVTRGWVQQDATVIAVGPSLAHERGVVIVVVVLAGIILRPTTSPRSRSYNARARRRPASREHVVAPRHLGRQHQQQPRRRWQRFPRWSSRRCLRQRAGPQQQCHHVGPSSRPRCVIPRIRVDLGDTVGRIFAVCPTAQPSAARRALYRCGGRSDRLVWGAGKARDAQRRLCFTTATADTAVDGDVVLQAALGREVPVERAGGAARVHDGGTTTAAAGQEHLAEQPAGASVAVVNARVGGRNRQHGHRQRRSSRVESTRTAP